MGNPGWHNYYVNENRNVTIIHETTIINNYSGTNRNRYSYAPGPDPNEVRRVSGNDFHTVQIREANTPGERVSGSQYVIYHPRVNANPAARGDANGRPATPAPARVEQFSNTRPSAQYPANNQRPASENPGNNQPVYNQRPANNLPANTPPANSQRQEPVNPNNNRPGNNQPAYNQRPANDLPD